MAPSLVPFVVAHLSQIKRLIFVCRYVEPFRSYALPIDGGPRKLRFFPSPNFLWVGEKKSKAGDQPWNHPNIVCKFRLDPFRDGRDPMSRNCHCFCLLMNMHVG